MYVYIYVYVYVYIFALETWTPASADDDINSLGESHMCICMCWRRRWQMQELKSRAPNGTYVTSQNDVCSIWRPRLELEHIWFGARDFNTYELDSWHMSRVKHEWVPFLGESRIKIFVCFSYVPPFAKWNMCQIRTWMSHGQFSRWEWHKHICVLLTPLL